MPILLKERSILPGFSLSLGYTVLYLSLIVLLPLSALVWKTAELSWHDFVVVVTSKRVLASYYLSFGAAAIAGLVNVVAGLLIAWVLVRYRFPGRRIIDGLIDLPFALPTAVAGITLCTLYAPNGWLGGAFAHGGAIGSWFPATGWAAGHLYTPENRELGGIKIAYAPLGITIALVFIGLPFVVRTVQPVLESLGPEMEEAAASLGAGRLRTFSTVIWPEIWPAVATGFALSFARGVGEYGSVVFIAGNQPMKTEIAPLLIITKLEQYDYAGATAIAVSMLLLSFVMLMAIGLLQRLSRLKGV
jgi:sulfate/thiosulfate transport system permease protein